MELKKYELSEMTAEELDEVDGCIDWNGIGGAIATAGLGIGAVTPF